ncbi:hypothetical protein CXF74_16060 [Psychromonas sp. Urea-02u-13]|nr:hypothetical protein CXF74_16060 [Psychromonas sp. Urea-02u-13]
MFLDSAGFPFYLVLLPVALFTIKDTHCLNYFKDTLVNICIAFSVISILIVVFFYYIFGQLDLATITAGNTFLSGFLNLKLGATAGILRVNTNSIQVLFLGLYIVLAKNNRSFKDSMIVLLFFIAFLADGHRAGLVVFLMMYFSYLILYKRFTNIFIVTIFSLPIIIYNSASIYKRVDFGSESSSARVEQIGPLIDKISESPIIGSGFGSSASLLRSETRPFMYEMDTLAISMKLGLPFAIIYTLLWFIVLVGNTRFKYNSRTFLFSFVTLVGCLFYMSTNGGFYMSPLTTILQFLMFLSFVNVPQNAPKKLNLCSFPIHSV